MCKFYKVMNSFFKEFFTMLTMIGVLALIFGFIYFLYTLITNEYENLAGDSNMFVIEYLFLCISAIAFGIGAADFSKKDGKKD